DAGASLSYSIVGGADTAKFTIDAATGALAFVTAPDFEHPTDAGGNNVYDVTVQVSDGAGGIATQAIAVTVTDVIDNAPVVDGPVTGNATEDGAPVALNALANASDPDSGTTLSIVNLPATLPAGVSFSTGPIPLAQFAGISIPIDSNDGGSHPNYDG